MALSARKLVQGTFHLIAICSLLVGAKVIDAQRSENQTHPLRIYVAALEGTKQAIADTVTAKLISQLVKHGLSVVESEENADAILAGAGMIEESSTEYGHTRVRLHAGMRLVSKDKGTVIWADDVASGKFAQSATSSFAENVAKSLEEALRPKPDKR